MRRSTVDDEWALPGGATGALYRRPTIAVPWRTHHHWHRRQCIAWMMMPGLKFIIHVTFHRFGATQTTIHMRTDIEKETHGDIPGERPTCHKLCYKLLSQLPNRRLWPDWRPLKSPQSFSQTTQSVSPVECDGENILGTSSNTRPEDTDRIRVLLTIFRSCKGSYWTNK